MARPEQLADEARSGMHPSLERIIGKIHEINPEAQVVVIDPGDKR
jgi:hypothetical protein